MAAHWPWPVERKPGRLLWAGHNARSWQTSTVWFSPACVRISHRHHKGRVLLYFTHLFCFPKTTTWWQAEETTNPSPFCPQTDCLRIKITADTVQRAGAAKLYSWVCLLKHFSINFFSLFSFDQTPRRIVGLNGKSCQFKTMRLRSERLTELGFEGFVFVFLCVWQEYKPT